MAQAASQKDPSFVDAYSMLAEAYTYEAADFVENAGHNLAWAEQAARKALTLNPRSFEANQALGFMYTEEGKHAEAIRILREALTHGRMLLYQGKAHEAEQEARQGLARNPDQFKLMAYLGDFLYYQGKLDEADRVVKRSIELRGPAGAPEPGAFLAFVQASRG